MLGLLVSIAGGVLLVVLLVIYILSRIKVAGPNEAFIITGRKGRSVIDPEMGARRSMLRDSAS